MDEDYHQPVTSPVQLPDFRLWLLEQWLPGGLFDVVWHLANDPKARRAGLSGLTMDARFDKRCLEKATLWWVTADMADLIDHAAKLLPPTTLTEDLLPAITGLVVFETPLIGRDAEMPEREVLTHAMVWGEANIIEDPDRRHTSISSYSYRAFPGDGPDDEDEGGRLWSPMGRTDWTWGTDTDTPLPPYAGDEHAARAESMAEDRRWFAAFCLLASQSNVVERSEVEAPRAVRRRSERAQVTSTVNLVDVRHRRVTTGPAGHRDVEWSRRWIVEGHWRQQVYGPGRTMRRPQWINSFVKGPDDKPLVLKDRVHVIKP